LSVTAVSGNDGNHLGGTVTFTGQSYTPRAICIQSDGTVVTSGSDSQKGKRVLVLVQTKLFNTGDTQSGLNQVQTWVSFYDPYTLTYTAQVIGDNTTQSSASVSTEAMTLPSSLDLSITNSGSGTAMLSLYNAPTNFSYRIWSTTSLVPSSWQFAGIINSSNAIPVAIDSSVAAKFWRASIQ
jgi:hypothetical protein